MRYDGIDWLRGMAAFGIVGCHLALSPMDDKCWRIHDLCDMNVGLFAALSGFLMWKQEGLGGLKNYVNKRCSRLLPIYLVWTLVFMIFGFVFDIFIRHGINEKWLRWSFYPKVLFGGQISAHLWFLICLLYVQIIVAAFANIFNRIGQWGLLAMGFAISVVSSYYMNIWIFGYPVRMLGFVLTGYALMSVVKKSGDFVKRWFLLWLGVALITTIMHYCIRPCVVPVFVKDWFLTIPLIMTAVSMPKIISDKISRVGSLLGKTSMGVYLVHPIITAGFGLVIRKMFDSPYTIKAFVFDLMFSYTIALLIAIVMNAVRPIQKFVR